MDFARFCLEHYGNELDEDGALEGLRNTDLRKRWEAQNEIQHLDLIRRLSSHQPGSQLHRFIWGDYACLSYVWGEQTNTRYIYINGHPVNVTENLESALRQFHEDGLFCNHFLLWVDALCINQNDAEERAREVQRMKDVYRVAWTVEAWLGTSARHSEAGLQLLQDMAAFRRAGCEVELTTRLRQDPHYLGSTGWLGLHSIMDRTYWYRLWIIQEIVMGGSAVWVWCGASKISWEHFCDGVATLQEHLWLLKDKCLNVDVHVSVAEYGHAWKTTSLHLVYQDLSTLDKKPLTSNPAHAFGRLLDLANLAECTDARDKVYALIGLFPVEVTQLLRPDYTASLAEVYLQTSQAFCQAYGNLEPLREGNPWGPSLCPSWAADWLWSGRIRHSRNERRLWGPTYLFSHLDQDGNLIPYSASGRRESDFNFFADQRLLRCEGLIVDQISGLSAAGSGYFRWNTDTIARPEAWRSAYGGFESTQEALMRTLLLDRVRFGKKPGFRHRAILNLPATFEVAAPQFRTRGWEWLAGQAGYYFRWERFRRAIDDFPLGKWLFRDFFSDHIPQTTSEYDLAEVYACSERSVKKRRFMTTEKGLMGWAPDNMFGLTDAQTQRGDLIAIIFGCSTPIVIRPVGDKYHVLGEAYVQGLMDGEATSLGFETQSFVFC